MSRVIIKDEAVSPVVAFMLLLMVVVSFVSILNTYYIPSLKQQAEIEHLHSVEQSFFKLSSDIFQVLTFRQNMSMNEPVQLGGGEIALSPLKSSGYLEVNTTLQDKPLVNITLSLSGKTIPELYSEINRTKIIFRPVGNFWINQGYEWEDGIVNVTKGTRWTYLQYINDDKVSQERGRYYEMFSPQISFEEYQNNITSITINLVNIENPGFNRSYSSNGAGMIFMKLKESVKKEVTNLKDDDTLIFQICESKNSYFRVNSTIDNSFSACEKKNNVIWYSVNHTLIISKDPAPDLTITRWNLSIHC